MSIQVRFEIYSCYLPQKAVRSISSFLVVVIILAQVSGLILGGAGHHRHFLSCFISTSVSGVASGNIFHFTENSYPRAKVFLKEKSVNVR